MPKKDFNIPSTHVIEQLFSKEIEGYDFDFNVKVSVLGEMLEIECLSLQLPHDAQVMVYGDKLEKVKYHIDAFQNLFFYQLPFMVHDSLKIQGFNDLANRIKKKNTKLNLSKDPNQYIKSVWFQKFYAFSKLNVKNLHYLESQGLSDLLFILGDNQGQPKYMECLDFLPYEKFELARPVLRSLIPLLKNDQYKKVAYKALKKLKEEGNRKFLHREFFLKGNEINRGAIITGLSVYDDDETYWLLMNFYNQNKFKLKEEELRPLLTSFLNFKTDQVEYIAWTLLVGKNRTSGYHAFSLLKKFKYSEYEICKRLSLAFKNPRKIANLKNILSHYMRIKNEFLHPFPVDLIDGLVEYCSKYRSMDISGVVADLLARSYEKSVSERLFKRLIHPSPFVKQAVLNIIWNLYTELKLPEPFLLTRKIYLKIEELCLDTNVNVQAQAIIAVGGIAKKRKNALSIFSLLKTVNLKNVTLAKASLEAINLILSVVPFDDAILPLYLRALNHKNVLIRISAINGLKYSKSKIVWDKLKLLKDDPNVSIRTAVDAVLTFGAK